jgi:hypothetical protein
MTKEVLLALGWFDGPTETRTFHERDLIKFFSQNVVIPKGGNMHELVVGDYCYVSDSILDENVQRIYLGYFNGMYLTVSGDTTTSFENGEEFDTNLWYYAEPIKPKEPVYEYLWLDLRTPDDFYCPTNKYMTELEAEAYFRPSHTWFKVLETKRIRE